MSKNRIKQAIALLLALVLIMGGITFDPAQAAAAAGNTIEVRDAYYIILPTDNKTAEYVKPAKKTCTSAHIPDTVRIGGKDYKVVSIKAGAFKGNRELIKVSIGKNVKTIGKKAFYGCKSLSKLSIFSKNLTSKTVAKDAFKGISTKGWAVVPESRVSKYKKLVGSCGASVKKWDFKFVSKELQDKTTWDNYEQGEPLPEPEIIQCGFFNSTKQHEIDRSTKSDGISLYVKTVPDVRLFGNWEKEGTYDLLYHCNICGRNCDWVMNVEHISLMDCDYWHTSASKRPYNGWFFYPDDDPLKVTYEFVLPDGLIYKESSLKVWVLNAALTYVNRMEYCDVQVSGNRITVTVDDLKSEPFYHSFNKEGYDRNPDHYDDEYENTPDEEKPTDVVPALQMNLQVKFSDSPQPDNPITATVTYEYKNETKTFAFDTLMVHCKTYKY